MLVNKGDNREVQKQVNQACPFGYDHHLFNRRNQENPRFNLLLGQFLWILEKLGRKTFLVTIYCSLLKDVEKTIVSQLSNRV